MIEPLGPGELKELVGKEVEVAGWVHDTRRLGGITFILLRNTSGVVQITVKKERKELIELANSLHQEDVIVCKGIVASSKQAKGGVEVVPSEIKVISSSEVPLPLDPRGVTQALLDTRFEWRSLDLRTERMRNVFLFTNSLVNCLEEYLQQRGFIRVFTPSIIGGISEGGAEVFKLDYFGNPAFLRQDPQLHRQLTIAGGFERIYDLGTNWRAELSHTPRHLCEYRTIAPELAFIHDEYDIIKLEQDLLYNSLVKVRSKCKEMIEEMNASIEVKKEFPVLEFPDVYEIVESRGGKVVKGEDLDTDSLRILSRYVKEKFDSDFFFLNKFPSRIRPFYVMRYDDNKEYARSVDLIFRGLELSSGGQREHRHKLIIEQAKEKGIEPSSIKWFTEVFRYGVPPHGGFSLGIERLVYSVLNLENVKEASLFVRDPDRLLP